MASKDKRRDARLASGDPVRLAWEDAATGPTFVIGKCVDVSAAGLKIEVQVAVPVRARIMVRVESLGLSGSAVVKHSLRRGAKYVIGVELSSGRLAKIREPIEKR